MTCLQPPIGASCRRCPASEVVDRAFWAVPQAHCSSGGASLKREPCGAGLKKDRFEADTNAYPAAHASDAGFAQLGVRFDAPKLERGVFAFLGASAAILIDPHFR